MYTLHLSGKDMTGIVVNAASFWEEQIAWK